jgi:hypothetical protein
MKSEMVQELLIKRAIKAPNNIKSKYGYSNRFNLSFFPKTKSEQGSNLRWLDNYYDVSKICLAIEQNPHQSSLFGSK